LGLGIIGKGNEFQWWSSDDIVDDRTFRILTLALNSGNVVWYKPAFLNIDSSMITSTSFRNEYLFAYSPSIFRQAFLLSTSDSGLLVRWHFM
jgi:hypothetical protein